MKLSDGTCELRRRSLFDGFWTKAADPSDNISLYSRERAVKFNCKVSVLEFHSSVRTSGTTQEKERYLKKMELLQQTNLLRRPKVPLRIKPLILNHQSLIRQNQRKF